MITAAVMEIGDPVVAERTHSASATHVKRMRQA
jgi:hypothetical protein